MTKTFTPFAVNCLTLTRFGEPGSGIKLDTTPGHDLFRPLKPRVQFNRFYVAINRADAPQVEGGTVYLAVSQQVDLGHGKCFLTLAKPPATRPATSLILVQLGMPHAKSTLMVEGVPVKLYTGVSGGHLIERDQRSALVELTEGQVLTAFFEDGGVRQFRRQGQKLDESFTLTTDEMLTERLAEAQRLVKETENEKSVVEVLMGMIDLLRMTVRFNQRGLGQEMRMRILQEFFCELAPAQRQSCFGKLGWVLSEVDPALCSLLSNCNQTTTRTYPRDKVVDIADRREQVTALSPEQAAERKAENIRRNEDVRAAKRVRQAEFKAKRSAARPAINPAKKQKKKAA